MLNPAVHRIILAKDCCRAKTFLPDDHTIMPTKKHLLNTEPELRHPGPVRWSLNLVTPKRMSHILLLDGDQRRLNKVIGLLRGDGHTLSFAQTAQQARQALLAARFDLILMSDDLPGRDTPEMMAAIAEVDSSIALVVAGGAKAPAAEQETPCTVLNIADLTRPTEIRSAVSAAAKMSSLQREELVCKANSVSSSPTDALVGSSNVVHALHENIAQAAASDLPVLILGETGTGKEGVARAIHSKSRRAAKCFCRISGQRAGEVLTHGPDAQQSALLRAAGHGTVFLDGVTDTSSEVQAALVRLLQRGEVRYRDSSEMLAVQARVLLAPSTDGHDGAASTLLPALGSVETITLRIPPVRDRLDDLAALCDQFSQQTSDQFGMPRCSISSAALDKLRGYSFPGNLDEVRNLIERAYMLSQGRELEASHFLLAQAYVSDAHPAHKVDSAAMEGAFDLLAHLQRVEEDLIRRTLQSVGGAQAEAARRMGISRSLLAYKLNKYGIRPAEGARGAMRS